MKSLAKSAKFLTTWSHPPQQKKTVIITSSIVSVREGTHNALGVDSNVPIHRSVAPGDHRPITHIPTNPVASAKPCTSDPHGTATACTSCLHPVL